MEEQDFEVQISGWSAKELKAYLAQRGVDHSSCFEKAELIELALKVHANEAAGSQHYAPPQGGASASSVPNHKEEPRVLAKQNEDEKSYYEILGVEKTSTQSEIKKAYYKMAMKVM